MLDIAEIRQLLDLGPKQPLPKSILDKMVTSDDDSTVDIIVEGDAEEIERFRRELDLTPKGMVRVKGILEKA